MQSTMLFAATSRSFISRSAPLFGRDGIVPPLVRGRIRPMSSVAQSSDNNPAASAVAAFSSSTAYSAKREIHNDTPRMQEIAFPPAYYPEESGVASRKKMKEDDDSGAANASSEMLDRFRVTAEVTVSKIFPAGFGWQSSSILASNYMGCGPDTIGFALTTGLGDGVGVFAGHCLYNLVKRNVTRDLNIDMERESQTGILLASAAFCSGTAWQPLVNALQGAELSFFQVFAGTWIGCGTAFYLGLRGARTILSGPFKYIHGPTFENSITDKSLSAAIGGATGFFVGTDTAYLPAQNFLINVVGIHETTTALTGCAIAGTSTSLGFASAQSTLNVIYPSGKLWNDGK
ncbi:hypothetical protein ACHAXA_002133 [Cyclostephanos tholiformis]|uniref:Uncharacterized protein n=1 Tax=Cyclostephanos tholiformis TaxID=382380 RepID=A0ABD3RQY3_9STRA